MINKTNPFHCAIFTAYVFQKYKWEILFFLTFSLSFKKSVVLVLHYCLIILTISIHGIEELVQAPIQISLNQIELC